MGSLEVKDLKVKVEENEIVRGVSFVTKPGTITVIMGKNGSGKSSIAHGLAGHPTYEAIGKASIDGTSILELDPEDRSKAGLFLSFQHPVEIEGIQIDNFLRHAMNARRDEPIRISEFKRELAKQMDVLNLDAAFAKRYLNKGFSGGEKKKMEILQLLMLKPKVAILDETDSGLDVDALKEVCNGILTIKKERPDTSIIIITHHKKILEYLHPDTVLLLHGGHIVKKGGSDLAEQIEQQGYEPFLSGK